MSNRRDRTLEDFREVLEWISRHELDATVIGGMAVGALVAQRGSPCFSGDLDLLVSHDEQARFCRLADADPEVEVLNRPRPRSLPVLVLGWGNLEVDVLVASDGLASPDEARKRAWEIGGVRVGDPVDLLGIKLELRRQKDVPHIHLLREVCDGAAIGLFTQESGRAVFEFLRRWANVEGWERLPSELFDALLECCENTSGPGRCFLVQNAPTRGGAEAVIAVAPSSERARLRDVLSARFD